MNILLLGPLRRELISYMTSFGDHVDHTEENINGMPGLKKKYDLLVSYGYRHIIRKDVIRMFPNRIVNLHISYLPWNRGADPNVWSFLEDTPKGVTIHHIDDGIDTGNILAQRRVVMTEGETLKTSYDKLATAIEQLFREVWTDIRVGKLAARPQMGIGTYHKSSDLLCYRAMLSEGWDTPTARLIGLAFLSKSEAPYAC